MKVFEQASDLIGNTPLVRLNGYQKEKKLDAELLAKLEYFNPAGSVNTLLCCFCPGLPVEFTAFTGVTSRRTACTANPTTATV